MDPKFFLKAPWPKQEFLVLWEKQKHQHDSPPFTFANLPKPTSQRQNSNSATLSPPTVSTAKLLSSSASPQPQNTYFPPLRLLPTLPTSLLASVQQIRGLLFLRRKLCLRKASFIPLIPRPQSRTHLIRRYLSPLTQWLTTQRQSGLHSAVRNQLSSLAILYATPSNGLMRIKSCPLKGRPGLRPRHGNPSSETGFKLALRWCPLPISLKSMNLPKRID